MKRDSLWKHPAKKEIVLLCRHLLTMVLTKNMFWANKAHYYRPTEPKTSLNIKREREKEKFDYSSKLEFLPSRCDWSKRKEHLHSWNNICILIFWTRRTTMKNIYETAAQRQTKQHEKRRRRRRRKKHAQMFKRSFVENYFEWCPPGVGTALPFICILICRLRLPDWEKRKWHKAHS